MKTNLQFNRLLPNIFRGAPGPHAWALGVSLALSAQADPNIVLQPTNSTVSLGATVDFRVTASTDNPPVQYQWQRAGATTPLTFTNLPGATDPILRITNVLAGQAGFYQAVVCNGAGGCLTSHVAELKVDPTFFKITGQPIVEDVEPTQSGSWHDYDGDGYLDLLVLNSSFESAPRNSLYHNDRKGFFTRVTNALSTLSASSWVGVWGDFDNDGRSDVYVSHPKFFNGYVADTLYRNQGDGVFAGVVTPWLTNRNQTKSFQDVSWVDLDMDGWVDLFATVWSVESGNLTGRQSVVFQNLSDGGFQSSLQTGAAHL